MGIDSQCFQVLRFELPRREAQTSSKDALGNRTGQSQCVNDLDTQQAPEFASGRGASMGSSNGLRQLARRGLRP